MDFQQLNLFTSTYNLIPQIQPKHKPQIKTPKNNENNSAQKK